MLNNTFNDTLWSRSLRNKSTPLINNTKWKEYVKVLMDYLKLKAGVVSAQA